MVGIDYNIADASYREQFAFPIERQIQIAKGIVHSKKASGCVILSTCNRTEVWFSGLKQDPVECFFEAVDSNIAYKQEEYFFIRSGEEAVEYLMELGCGVHSQIFGEDQILTQLKQAITQARENQYVDAVLETLYRTAITAAKKVKSSVILSTTNTSLPETILYTLKKEYGSLAGKACMVIGNGEMGRLMADELVREGCQVQMTLRQYKKSEAVIPAGCDVVLYDHRYSHMEQQDYIFSATRSPHYTIKKEEVLYHLKSNKHYKMIDMAIPRDIDPQMETVEGVTVYRMDDFGVEQTCSKENLLQMQAILQEYKEDFMNWYELRKCAPIVNDIGLIAGEITDARLSKVYKSLELPYEEQLVLQNSVQVATKKAVSKLLFGVRQNLQAEQWSQVLDALEQSAKNCR